MSISTGTGTRISGYLGTESIELYVLDCARCGVVFAINRDYEQRRRKDGSGFYCPNGHSNIYQPALEAEKQKRQIATLERRLANAQEDARAANASLITTKGHLTRARKRADKGLCLHCNRHFANVERHVAHMHPEKTT